MLAPATLVGSRVGHRRAARSRRERWQMSYIVVPVESTERHARRSSRALPGSEGVPMTKPFRFGVQISQRRVGERRGATRRASSKTSGTRRCSCPTTSARSWRRCPRSRWPPRTPPRLKVGALVFDNDYKHPAILAKEAATIDLLSDGRLELGIGAGWMKTDYDALGLPYDPPAVRVDRFEEALQVIKQCFAGEQFSVRRRALPHHRLHVVPEAGAGAPADPRRRRRQARALDRGARGRHHRHQPQPARGRGRARTRPPTRSRSRPTARSHGSGTQRGTGATRSRSRCGSSCARSPTTG